jgi:hypothetical protein
MDLPSILKKYDIHTLINHHTWYFVAIDFKLLDFECLKFIKKGVKAVLGFKLSELIMNR